jgi:hypothetical protein
MRRLLAVACAVVAAGCGGSSQRTFDANQVERAFRAQGIVLDKLPSNGAEQTAMGTTSPCATGYFGRANMRMLAVWVCESAGDAHKLPLERLTIRANVAVELLNGGGPELRGRVERALAGLD